MSHGLGIGFPKNEAISLRYSARARVLVRPQYRSQYRSHDKSNHSKGTRSLA